jgi:hypothetical protein
MNWIVKFISAISKVFDALGICATVGFIAGGLSGLVLTIYAMDLTSAPTLTAREIWQVGLVLAAATAGLLLFYLYVLCRYTLSSVFMPVVLNCLLTCLLTVWLVDVTGLWDWAFFVGTVVGLLVGRLLCIFCQFAAYRADVHGMY